MSRLLGYRWPGNVRELENAIERLNILASGDTIGIEHIPDSISVTSPCPELIPLDIPESGVNLEQLLQSAEKTLLFKALDRSHGVKTEAAKLLGLSFRSFRHRLRKYEQSS
jgi:two-component system response regulator PilR (NtrC family)